MEETFDLEKIKDEFLLSVKEKFKEKVGSFTFQKEKESEKDNFSIEFEFYSYLYATLHFKNGEIYFSIFDNQKVEGIHFRNSQNRYENLDMELFLNEVKKEIELRIPDKFLKQKGWQE